MFDAMFMRWMRPGFQKSLRLSAVQSWRLVVITSVAAAAIASCLARLSRWAMVYSGRVSTTLYLSARRMPGISESHATLPYSTEGNCRCTTSGFILRRADRSLIAPTKFHRRMIRCSFSAACRPPDR